MRYTEKQTLNTIGDGVLSNQDIGINNILLMMEKNLYTLTLVKELDLIFMMPPPQTVNRGRKQFIHVQLIAMTPLFKSSNCNAWVRQWTNIALCV